MEVRFPPVAEMNQMVKKQGFVGRALLINGHRAETLPVEVYRGRKIEPQNFGYIAGSATYVTSGLEHCTMVALFDHQSRLGAAGHFQVVSDLDPLPRSHESLNEFIANLEDMRNTLELMGANRERLQAFCAFGMTSPTSVAPALDILRVLNDQNIPVPKVALCREGDFVYQVYLRKGRINYYLDGTTHTNQVFKAGSRRPDRASRLLGYAEQAIEYFNGICGTDGRSEFLGAALPYLAVKHFDKPEIFFTYAMRAVDAGSERPLHSKDPEKETIGEYFRGLVKV